MVTLYQSYSIVATALKRFKNGENRENYHVRGVFFAFL